MSPELLKIPSMTMTESFMASVVGFGVVFFVLIVLMFMIQILRGIVEKMDASKAAAAPAAAAPAPVAIGPTMVPAKGSLGDIKLYDVEDKTAAMLMAIVADELKAPLNELRFLSIREKK